MIDPYRMIVVNIALSLLLAFGVFTFVFIYPKKKINLLALLIVISLLPLVSILRKGGYESGVLTENAQITRSFFESLAEGNIFPTWNAAIYAGYGNPTHLFQYPFPYYLGSFIHILGFSYLSAAKAVLIATYLISGIGMYMWIRIRFGNIAGFTAAVFYLFTPFHLTEMHFRATFGTTTAYAAAPFIFLFLEKLSKKNDLKYFFGGGISFALFILSDLAILFLSLPIIFSYIFYIINSSAARLKKIIIYAVPLFIGSIFASFYILPAMLEGKYLNFIATLSTGDFKPILSYFYSPTLFGLLFQGHHGETHFIIGYAQLTGLVISTVLLLRKNVARYDRTFLLILFSILAFYLFMTQPISKPVWDLPFFKNVLNSWKILFPISLITSINIAIVVKTVLNTKFSLNFLKPINLKLLTSKFFGSPVKNQQYIIIFLLCLFAIFSTILNWGNRRMVPSNDEQIKSTWTALFSTDIMFLFADKWTDYSEKWLRKTPLSPMETTKGKASISFLSRSTTRHEYLVNAKTSVTLTDNTIYFPGWAVEVNNRPYPFDFKSRPNSGLINIRLPAGLYKITVVFRQTEIQSVSQLISLFAFLISLIILKFQKKVIGIIKNKKGLIFTKT